MSGRAYEDNKNAYNYLCDGNLIEWNQDLNIVVNPDPKNAQIFFTKKELLNYCLLCDKKNECEKDKKERLLNILWEKWEITKENKKNTISTNIMKL